MMLKEPEFYARCLDDCFMGWLIGHRPCTGGPLCIKGIYPDESRAQRESSRLNLASRMDLVMKEERTE